MLAYVTPPLVIVNPAFPVILPIEIVVPPNEALPLEVI